MAVTISWSDIADKGSCVPSDDKRNVEVLEVSPIVFGAFANITSFDESISRGGKLLQPLSSGIKKAWNRPVVHSTF